MQASVSLDFHIQCKPHRLLVKAEWKVLEERACVGFGPPSILPAYLGQLSFNFHLKNIPTSTLCPHASSKASGSHRKNVCVCTFSYKSQMETVCVPKVRPLKQLKYEVVVLLKTQSIVIPCGTPPLLKQLGNSCSSEGLLVGCLWCYKA